MHVVAVRQILVVNAGVERQLQAEVISQAVAIQNSSRRRSSSTWLSISQRYC
jgi:hypothetical protein